MNKQTFVRPVRSCWWCAEIMAWREAHPRLRVENRALILMSKASHKHTHAYPR